jgi:polyphosphate kinase
VLEQAQSDRHPLLERVRFLAIVSSNLDEFFEIRVAGLMQQMDSGVTEPGPDGLAPQEQLRRIHSVVASLVEDQYRCWQDQLVPRWPGGHPFPAAGDLSRKRRAQLGAAYFREQVYPVLTPLALDQAHPFPQLGNKTLNVVVSLDNPAAPDGGAAGGDPARAAHPAAAGGDRAVAHGAAAVHFPQRNHQALRRRALSRATG